MIFAEKSWISDAIGRLSVGPCGYHARGPLAAEPTAIAAIALFGAGRVDAAKTNLSWLAAHQFPDGSVPPLGDLQRPGWTTAWSIIAASLFNQNSQADEKEFDLARAQQWLLSIEGKTLTPSPEYGHDVQLIGWPWAIGTHSWQEPTAMSVLALKALGLNSHPRTREGIRLLVDRLLETGGCNYGNTIVMGQRLRPQVEPTGLTLLALGGEPIDDPRIERSLQYLMTALSAETTPISLSYGLLGLAAHTRRLSEADRWIETAYRHAIERDAGRLSIALLALAAMGNKCPLISITQQ